jgi:hypothetical protein
MTCGPSAGTAVRGGTRLPRVISDSAGNDIGDRRPGARKGLARPSAPSVPRPDLAGELPEVLGGGALVIGGGFVSSDLLDISRHSSAAR